MKKQNFSVYCLKARILKSRNQLRLVSLTFDKCCRSEWLLHSIFKRICRQLITACVSSCNRSSHFCGRLEGSQPTDWLLSQFLLGLLEMCVQQRDLSLCSENYDFYFLLLEVGGEKSILPVFVKRCIYIVI